MTFWKPLTVNGDAVDLAHLEPFQFAITPKDWKDPATVVVHFNNHCFSEDFDPARHDALLPATHIGTESRAFDAIRYQLSLQLPTLIQSLETKRIVQTRSSNLARIELTGGRHYGIFFTLRRKGPKLCEMFVVSAYPLEKPSNVAATGEMKFNVAVALVLRGQRPRFPPRN